MKFSKSLLAVSMSAMMLFSAPAAESGIFQTAYTAEAAVTKTPVLNKSAVTLTTGNGIQLSLRNADSNKITWKVSDGYILGVTQKGYVKGYQPGTAYVYAVYKGKTYKCKVTVKDDLSKAKLSKTSITMEKYDSFDLFLYNVPSDRIISFRSSNPAVAVVLIPPEVSKSPVFNIYAKKAGVATISIKYGGKTFQCKVTVKESKKTHLITDSLLTKVNKTSKLMLLNASGKTTWKSSNSKVARVSSNGTVTGVSAGKATITAYNNGKKYTCSVTVYR